jgi:hypothetical protein
VQEEVQPVHEPDPEDPYGGWGWDGGAEKKRQKPKMNAWGVIEDKPSKAAVVDDPYGGWGAPSGKPSSSTGGWGAPSGGGGDDGGWGAPSAPSGGGDGG